MIQLNCYVWAIKGKDGSIVVDTRCGTTWARQHGCEDYVNPREILVRIGPNGSKVSKVIISHLHWDHTGGIEMFPTTFPKANLYVQKKEFDFMMKSPYSKRAIFNDWDEVAVKITAGLDGTDRLVLTNGDQKIMPGIDEVLVCPGHTPALQAVAVVNTAKGTAIVGSDLFHVYEAFEKDVTSVYITDEIA